MYTWAVGLFLSPLLFFWSEILGQSWSLSSFVCLVFFIYFPSLLSSPPPPYLFGTGALPSCRTFRIKGGPRPCTIVRKKRKKKSFMLYMTKRPDHFQTNSKDIPRKTFSCYLSEVSRKLSKNRGLSKLISPQHTLSSLPITRMSDVGGSFVVSLGFLG